MKLLTTALTLFVLSTSVHGQVLKYKLCERQNINQNGASIEYAKAPVIVEVHNEHIIQRIRAGQGNKIVGIMFNKAKAENKTYVFTDEIEDSGRKVQRKEIIQFSVQDKLEIMNSFKSITWDNELLSTNKFTYTCTDIL